MPWHSHTRRGHSGCLISAVPLTWPTLLSNHSDSDCGHGILDRPVYQKSSISSWDVAYWQCLTLGLWAGSKLNTCLAGQNITWRYHGVGGYVRSARYIKVIMIMIIIIIVIIVVIIITFQLSHYWHHKSVLKFRIILTNRSHYFSVLMIQWHAEVWEPLYKTVQSFVVVTLSKWVDSTLSVIKVTSAVQFC